MDALINQVNFGNNITVSIKLTNKSVGFYLQHATDISSNMDTEVSRIKLIADTAGQTYGINSKSNLLIPFFTYSNHSLGELFLN